MSMTETYGSYRLNVKFKTFSLFCFHPWSPDGWVGGHWEKVCLGRISETIWCKKFILGKDIG